MRKLLLLVKKFLQNIGAEKGVFIVNLCVCAVAFLAAFGVVTLMSNLGSLIIEAREQFQLVAYLKPGADTARVEALVKAIGAFPEVVEARYVPAANFKKEFLSGTGPAIRADLEPLGIEAFPETVQVKLSPKFLEQESAAAAVAKIRQVDIVEEVAYHRDWMRQLSGLLKLIWTVGFIFCVLVLVSTVFVLSNMTQLSFARRSKAIEIMRLCGATNAFIEAPVLLEGLVLGLGGGLLALLLSWGAVALINLHIATLLPQLPAASISFMHWHAALALLSLCALTGMGGAHMAARKALVK